ncbi:SCO-spondin [Patella vulgata]|uniref:SCO-spondin n=1 Tax=Patella vulgata TaxID=6465 RepID=UPI00217F91E7|nr:SCO-spondin [Patella vulgata]
MQALILVLLVTTVTAIWDDSKRYYRYPVRNECQEVKKKGLCLFDDNLITFASSSAKYLFHKCCYPSDAVETAFIVTKNGDQIVKTFNGDFKPMEFDTCAIKGENFCPKCCEVNGNWGHWSPYGPCSQSCGTGMRTRTRNCDNPAPANGGSDCVGMPTETQSCNTQLCPAELCASFGYVYDPATNICIKIFQHLVNFFGAEKLCEEDGGVLLKLDSLPKRDFLQTQVDGDSAHDFIIGARDVTGMDEFEHLDGTAVVWIGPAPEDSDTMDCVRYVKSGQRMDETPCGIKRKFICERDVTPM